jgi:putative glycosyl hydrolase-like family 6 (GHL6) protein/glycosyl hydrolase family 42 (putative beta-galactosidase)
MDRRTFLRKSTAGMAGLSALPLLQAGAEGSPLDQELPEGQPADDGYQPPSWLRYPRAIYFDGKTPPLFPHLKDFNAEHLVKVVTRLGGDTLRFEPVSNWAYYPSKVFPVCPELGNRDLIDEVGRECRKAGVHYYCYTKFANPSMAIGWADNHPEYADWVLRGPDGKPYGTYNNLGWNEMQKPCTTSDAYRQAIRQVVRELCAHDIDGVYLDGPSDFGYTGICYCDSCRKNFLAYTGMDMDRLQDDKDVEARIAWFRWWNQVTLTELEACRKIIHESGKFMLCHNGDTWQGTSLRSQYRIPEGFMLEHSTEIYSRLLVGLMGASMARPYKKLAQMYLGSYCVSDFDEPPHCHPWVIHDANLEDGDEILMEGFSNLACGNAPLYATLNRAYFGIGSGSDHPVREVYEVMRRVESILKDSVPVPYATVVPTWEALQVWRTGRKTWNMEMSHGFALAMLDERLNLDVCPSTEVTASWLKGQRVIALCGASGVSNALAEVLADWVRGGGGLLATYDTGLYDEMGRMRPGGTLREVLGVEMKGEPLPSLPECYYRVKAAHPAMGDYSPGTLLMGDTQLVPTETLGEAQALADCWNLGTGEVRGQAIVVNNYGKGRTAYVAGSLEAQYVSSRVVSLRRLLSSLVRYVSQQAPPPFAISAPRGVYGVLRQAANGDLVLWLLANVGFKDADVGRMRQEFIPLSNVQVRVLMPKGRSVKAVHLVRAGHRVPSILQNGYAVAEIPVLHIAEIVHVELA